LQGKTCFGSTSIEETDTEAKKSFPLPVLMKMHNRLDERFSSFKSTVKLCVLD
jgi:hypothetical protein